MSVHEVVLIVGIVSERPKVMRKIGAKHSVRVSYLPWHSSLFPQIPLGTVAVILVRPHPNDNSWGKTFDSFVEHIRVGRKLLYEIVESTENFDLDGILTSVLSNSEAV